MTFEVNDDVYPVSAVAYIWARWGSYAATGTGFLVGRNDVVTAAHVIFDINRGGLANEVRVYPSYDPDEPNTAFFTPAYYHYYPDFDPDGDGLLISGDFNRPTYAGTERDVALLTMSNAIGDTYGWFGIDGNFLGGNVGVIGYPAVYNRQPMYDSGSITRNSVDNYYRVNADLEINGGNSGGPIYYDYGSGVYAVGVVSTRIGASALGGHTWWLLNEIANNDGFIGGANASVIGGAGADRLFGIPTTRLMQGLGGNDALNGGVSAETLEGGDGDDTIEGAAAADRIDGGAGYDVASYRNSGSGVSVSLASNNGWSGDATGDVLVSIESLMGSPLADVLVGNNDHNIIEGGFGGDVIQGQGGNDWVSYEYAGAGIAVNLAVTVDSGWAGDATGDDITTIENIRGSAYGDYLYGDSGANILRGDAGGDVLYGGGNSDTIYYSTSASAVSVNLSTNSATGGDAQGDVLVSVENVFATQFNDVLVGDSASNTLVGWLGIDALTGNGGNDIFRWTAIEESGLSFGTRDVVVDFFRAHGDLLDFSGIDANANLAGDQAFAFINFAAFSAAGQLRFTFDGRGNTIIEVNTGGSLAADMSVQLAVQMNMAVSDFVL
jgi:Ca2+-binding RTX toxin-like protein